MVDKQTRYLVSSIANFMIALFFLIYFYAISQIDFIYSIGLLILVFAFLIKFFADFYYAIFPRENVRRKFHEYTFMHYLLVGIILLIFPYFGYLYSFLFAALSLIFSYYELRHTLEPEEEIFRIRRHLMAAAFRWFVGSLIFFDSLYYNVIRPTFEGYLISILGVAFGIYILYSAIITYRYIKETSKIPIIKALTVFSPE